jgi:hypothetical protein
MADHPPFDFMTAPRVFVRVYRLPPKLIAGYCFGTGVPITFTNVDWFEALVSDGRERLVEFIKKKAYYDRRARFLVLGDDPHFTFTIEPAQ